MKQTKRAVSISIHPAGKEIAALLSRGLNFSDIAWRLNNDRLYAGTAPYAKDGQWTALLVNNVYSCRKGVN